MAVPRRNIRGLQNISTLSGSSDNLSQPYSLYMRLSCLEMEKFRRGEETASAMQRVDNINSRVRQINDEESAILEALQRRSTEGGRCARGGARGRQEDVSKGRTGGFKIRY